MKNILAIALGFLTVVILSILTDFTLESISLFPPASNTGLYNNKLLAIALTYRSIYTILGGYVTARLSADNTRKNIIILGTIGTIFGTLGVIAGWNLSHHWYPIALAVLGFPCIWLKNNIEEAYNS